MLLIIYNVVQFCMMQIMIHKMQVVLYKSLIINGFPIIC